MKSVKLSKWWDSLNSSFWFVPSLMVGLAMGLSFFTINIDRWLEFEIISDGNWLYSLGPSGSRAVLSVIAGSMVSVATTAFSITIVALQLASSQFGPRLLQNFMQDTGNQVVLGTFISTFVYSLMVLRTVNESEGHEFVPHVAVTFAIVLAIASIGVLIYFLHHAASSIQVDNVIKAVGEDLHQIIEQLFPETTDHSFLNQTEEVTNINIPIGFYHNSYSVNARNDGYIQAIDNGQLMRIATENNLIIQVQLRAGHFVVQHGELARVFPKDKVNKFLKSQINGAFVVGSKRTKPQDLQFSINQLVEIAVRALSPGINDPFTAVRCIDQISATLCHLARCNIPSPYRYDDDNQLRLVITSLTFNDVCDTAFNQIRQNGRSTVAVTIRLLEAIAVIVPFTYRPGDLAALQRQAQMIDRGSQEAIAEELDRQDIKAQYLKTISVINQLH